MAPIPSRERTTPRVQFRAKPDVQSPGQIAGGESLTVQVQVDEEVNGAEQGG